MNEELQKAITELFNSAIQAKDFLVGELPDYINQLLMWKAVASGISMTAFFAFCAAFVWANKKAFDSIKKSGERPDSPYCACRLYYCAYRNY